MKGLGSRVFLKILKVTGISVGTLLVLLFVLPFLFPKTIAGKVKQWVNSSITSELDFSKANLSFFTHFPALTLTLEDVRLTGSAPFSKETLLSAEGVSFGIDLFSVFSKSVKVDQVYLSGAWVNIKVDENGNANYNVYKSAGNSADTSSSDVGVQIEKIVIRNTMLNYVDMSVPFSMEAVNLNYTGKGDLAKAVFDLSSRLSADSFSLAYDHNTYVNNKQLKAKLITVINTKSLTLVFKDNRIRINKLPMHFSGHFDFLAHGYEMDLNVDSRRTDLENIITAIPPDMSGWLRDTKVKGSTVFNVRLRGRYDAGTNTMPDLRFNLSINDGYIKHKEATAPLEGLDMALRVRLPGLNQDSMRVMLDTFHFKLAKGFCDIRFHSLGLERPDIESEVKADLDLNTWDKAIGLKGVEFGGLCKLDLKAKGIFSRGQNPDNWRRETVITSIPSFSLVSTLSNGYLKFDSLPVPVQDISFNIRSSCADNNYRHTVLDISDINFAILKNYFRGNIKVTNPAAPDIDADISGRFHLGDLAKSFPMEDLLLDGDLVVGIKSKGVYDSERKSFPLTVAHASVKDGKLKTGYYPRPVERINLNIDITNNDGAPANTTIEISPLNFEFDGEPFTLTASLINPDDIRYNVDAKGILDLGKLYQVFGVPEYKASGWLRAALVLKGKQSDAMAGRYHLLDNSGTIELKDIQLGMQAFPKPLIINTGTFRFHQDRMSFDDLRASYDSMDFTMNGYFRNVIEYALTDQGVLKGSVSLTSDYIDLNRFTAFESVNDNLEVAGTDSAGTGVIVVPANLDVSLAAAVKKADFDSLAIHNFKGQVVLRQGKVQLQQTAMTVAGATFNLDGSYEPQTPNKARFDLKIKADSFSIERAYAEIPMFRELASSASGVKGLVALDYELSGRLDPSMQPVMPSIKGKGVINLKKVKLKGFRMMNAVSKSTNLADLADPPLSGINIKTSIKNNIINVERVKLRIAGFRPRFEGQISLDGDLNIKGRVGLPPFGIFGIPFTISGNSEHPVVKLKRDKDGKILQEKEDIDEGEEEVPEVLPAGTTQQQL